MGELRVGLISDTHGLLRPEALAALSGCDHIIHAGDIGSPDILRRLSAIARVSAVRGNNDREGWAQALPESLRVDIGGVGIRVVHDLADLPPLFDEPGVRVVVSGHSHQPRRDARNGVLYLNPGSAGPRRFRLPVTLAVLSLGEGGPFAALVELGGAGGSALAAW